MTFADRQTDLVGRNIGQAKEHLCHMSRLIDEAVTERMLLILNHIQYLSRSPDHRYHFESDHDLQSNLKDRGLLKSYVCLRSFFV